MIRRRRLTRLLAFSLMMFVTLFVASLQTRSRVSYAARNDAALSLDRAVLGDATANNQLTPGRVSSVSRGGATETTFDTLYGRVIVAVPTVVEAGDTFTGTVGIESAGTNDSEKSANSSRLDGTVIDIGGQRTRVENRLVTITVPTVERGEKPKPLRIDCLAETGARLGSTELVVNRPSSTAVISNPKPGDYHLPDTGQTGHRNMILGPMDGRIDTTQLTIANQAVNIIAESPRGCVFESPANVSGQVAIALKERNVSIEGRYRSIATNLSATKTELLRNESARLKLDVRFLSSISRDVPVLLDTTGVVTTEGGNNQSLTIHPSDVRPDGTYSTTRTITGQEQGAFSVTATVIVGPFDVWLQDDNSGNMLVFNSFSGNYSFVHKQPTAGAQPIAGQATVTTSGCAIKFQDTRSNHRIEGQFDTCRKSGNAKIKIPSEKTELKLKDSNTGDNQIHPDDAHTDKGFRVDIGPRTQPSATPSTPTTPTGGQPTTPLACPYQGQLVHVERFVGGGGGEWVIYVKLPDGRVVKVRIKSKEKPALKFCDWIKINHCDADKWGDITIDDWEEVDAPTPTPTPTPQGPKPGDTKPQPPKTDPPIPPETPTPTPTGDPGVTVPVKEKCKDAQPRKEHRVLSCEVVDARATQFGYGPDSTKIFKLGTTILRVAGAGRGVALGKLLASAFSSNAARHLYIKIKIKYVDEVWVCKNEVWVLESSVEGESTTGWTQLFDTQGGGGTNWLPGSTGADVEAAIDTAKAANGCP